MSSEMHRCPKCRHEYEAQEMADFLQCPLCFLIHKPNAGEPKPLDKVFETLMPYGKYRGTPFYKIPDSYLEWLETELLTAKDGKKESANLLEKLTAEIARRKKNPSARI